MFLLVSSSFLGEMKIDENYTITDSKNTKL